MDDENRSAKYNLADWNRTVGRRDGIEIGLRQGRKEGKKEGIRKSLNATAIKMLEKNLDINLIKDITNLSDKQIQKLQLRIK